MNKLLLYGHGGAYNHGAEAILRGSIPIFRKAGVPILLSTHFPEQDREFGLDRLVDQLIPADLSLVPKERAAESISEKERIAAQIYRKALAEIDDQTVCVGIGGDNYCYPNWYRQSIFHHAVKVKGGTSVLWGCSIQPELIVGRMAESLSQHDHIYARESITANALMERGVMNVTQIPDPAFLMPAESVALPEGFRGAVAAVNLSPLILRCSSKILEHFIETARCLLERADSLLLLPHVTMSADDDQEALALLEKGLTESERVRLCRIPRELNAAQRKYIISKCAMLVCCRTHASIAGYSSGVPTIVVGYSVKAQGIGVDLSMEEWVLPWEESVRLPTLAAKMWSRRLEIGERLAEKVRMAEKTLRVLEKSAKSSSVTGAAEPSITINCGSN